MQAIGLLPASHPWQGNFELQVGLRTGFCGSLTTFSSWELESFQMLLGGKGRDGGQWADVEDLRAFGLVF